MLKYDQNMAGKFCDSCLQLFIWKAFLGILGLCQNIGIGQIQGHKNLLPSIIFSIISNLSTHQVILRLKKNIIY